MRRWEYLYDYEITYDDTITSEQCGEDGGRVVPDVAGRETRRVRLDGLYGRGRRTLLPTGWASAAAGIVSRHKMMMRNFMHE